MQFSDTSNLQGLVQDCEFNCQLGSAGISGNSTLLKDFTRLFNRGLNSAVKTILSVQDEFDWDDLNQTNFPILTGNLVADQQDYSFPADILKIKRVELKLDGTNWYKAKPLDIKQLDIPTDTTTISERFSQDRPYYDVLGQNVFLYPIPTSAVTGGIKIWISREISKFVSTDTTKEPGIDDPFHDYISLFASYEYARAKGLKNVERLKRDLLESKQELADYYNKKQEDRTISINRDATFFNGMK